MVPPRRSRHTPGRAEAPIDDPAAWGRAAQLIDGIRHTLTGLPADDSRWQVACQGAAALTAALEERPGALSAVADCLAWSAQDPPRHRGAGNLAERRLRRDAGQVVRLIGQAARSGGMPATAMTAVVGVVLLATTIAEFHQRRRQPHQARMLAARAEEAAGELAAAVPWRRRPHGRLSAARLAALAAAVEADVDRLTRQERRRAELTAQARAGHGPQMTALRVRREELARAAVAEAALPAARGAAERAGRTLAQACARVRELETMAGHGRVRLGLQGTTRERVQADLALARREQRAARTRWDRAHEQVEALAAAARLAYGPDWREGDAAAGHRRMATGWERRRAQAAAAGFPRLAGRRPAGGLAEARQELAAVRAELALRQILPAGIAEAEKAQRSAAQPQAGRAPAPGPRRIPPRPPERGRGGRGR
ncbi:hypothetical protein ACFOWE_31165 [Planomonospora corallina]|uniref:Uncharacterized protein n=1 Tax=Planomonospora corallina TaxID=1806052 RepID=A0ABV8IJY1_9ACTN